MGVSVVPLSGVVRMDVFASTQLFFWENAPAKTAAKVKFPTKRKVFQKVLSK
jgi:hypothetical protein